MEANVQLKSQYSGIVSSGGLVDVGATIKALKAGLLIVSYQDSNWAGIDPLLPIPRFYDSIYQTL